MNKNTYRITEDDLKVIMESVVKRVLTEGSSNTEDLITWEDIKEIAGPDYMLQMIWNYLNADQLREIMGLMKEDLEGEGIL